MLTTILVMLIALVILGVLVGLGAAIYQTIKEETYWFTLVFSLMTLMVLIFVVVLLGSMYPQLR